MALTQTQCALHSRSTQQMHSDIEVLKQAHTHMSNIFSLSELHSTAASQPASSGSGLHMCKQAHAWLSALVLFRPTSLPSCCCCDACACACCSVLLNCPLHRPTSLPSCFFCYACACACCSVLLNCAFAQAFELAILSFLLLRLRLCMLKCAAQLSLCRGPKTKTLIVKTTAVVFAVSAP